MTQQEIKDNYAKSLGYEEWDELPLIDYHIDQVMKLFAKYVAQQALDNASENTGLIWNIAIGPYRRRTGGIMDLIS